MYMCPFACVYNNMDMDMDMDIDMDMDMEHVVEAAHGKGPRP